MIGGRVVQLTNKSSMWGGAFKHKEKKLGVLCDVFLLLNNFFEQQPTLYKMYLHTSQRLLECFCCFSALLLVHKSKASLPKTLKCLTSNIVPLRLHRVSYPQATPWAPVIQVCNYMNCFWPQPLREVFFLENTCCGLHQGFIE